MAKIMPPKPLTLEEMKRLGDQALDKIRLREEAGKATGNSKLRFGPP